MPAGRRSQKGQTRRHLSSGTIEGGRTALQAGDPWRYSVRTKAGTSFFRTTVFGFEVIVQKVDFNEGDEIVAFCRRGKDLQANPILDLQMPSPPPAGVEWIEAYRWWAKGGDRG